MDFSLWLAFVAASTALLLIPGPTVLLVLAYAIGQGRRVAVPTALGVAKGDLIAMSASLAGLGALVLTSATLFTALKWVGAAYLVWLGIRMLRGAGAGAGAARFDLAAAEGAIGVRTAFLNAATVTALNPKSIVFFIAFVPQFLDPGRPFLPQAAILIATFVALAGINALAYAIAAGRLRDTIRRPAVIAWLTRAGGATLIGVGVATAAVRRAAS
ncbi:LysE family translocator [Ovoidimarina sediminis]|uniref:LysE family translocator n=1 Tax=Ovoidimarina sediminis TaxID=3079856 RepID=UPI002909E27B|nr:LysE family translocator [Rhodophyticola sp. MJ-SS7]MDU8942784.1 LysE family translocator [Rhodophyticola sp. MJ-SS7]